MTLRMLPPLTALLLLVPAAVWSQQAPSPTVGVVKAEKRPVSQAAKFVGRIEAVERVDINARVTGYLQEVLFKDGQTVEKGQPLYRIERAPFDAALSQSKADVLRNQATLENATLQRERADTLVKTNDTPVATRDQRVAEEKAAQGSLLAAQAAQQTAEINLGYTEIQSPIAGKIGKTSVTPGNVVSPQSGALATIVSIDPMYVTFPVSQRDFLPLSQQQKSQPGAAELKVTVTFSNGVSYPHPGTINFVDVKVDRATDTVLVRATLPNPDNALVDGQLVQVAVESKEQQERITIPQVALIADQQGPYVFVVEDGKIAIRRLKVGQTSGASIIVESGLDGGELVVTEGGLSLRPGVAVTATPAAQPLGG